jgi:LPXTG-motif cell wall-anchored protein
MSRSRATAVRSRVAVAVLTAGIAAVGTASTASGAVPPAGTFTVRTVNADPNDPTVHPYFTLSLAAGRSTTQHVEVGNPTDASVNLVIDGVEGRTAQTSGAVYANRKDVVARAGKWVTPQTTRLTVAPHTSVPVGFTVKVPARTNAGDHLAGLAVQNTDPQVSGDGFKIRQILRTVVGVLVTVPGATVGFHPLVISAGIAKLPGPKVASVSVVMANDGRALGKPDLKIKLTGPNYTRTVTRTLDTLLPADAITYPYAWPDALAIGKYSITVWLTGGGTTVKYQTTVTLGAALRGVNTSALGSDPPLPRSGSSGMPWSIIAVVGLVGVAGGLLLRRRPAFLRRHQSVN